jgi:hypothetical protein
MERRGVLGWGRREMHGRVGDSVVVERFTIKSWSNAGRSVNR